MADDDSTPNPEAEHVPTLPAGDAPKPKKKGSPASGVIGFIMALGGGFFIGQWINNRGKDDVEIAEGPRYAVELRGDEPMKGPADALVTIIEFADYQCPYCVKAAGPIEEIVAEFDEDVRLIYKHYPLPGHPKALPAARASWAALQQGKFWELHAWAFANTADLSALDAKVEELGLDKQKFLADMASEEAKAAIDSDMLAGGKLGVRGTPVLFVNGHRYVGLKTAPQLRAIVEAELEEAEKLIDRGATRANVYATLMQDAKVRDDSPKTDDRAQLGPSDALVTIVTFSDFQCPFCSRLATTVHEIAERHPDVRIVFRNLPLDMHPRARECAKAALAAGRQGKFWEMHDAMFAAQKSLGSIAFADLAAKIGIDVDRFTSDMADPELDRLITEDEALASQFKVRGTPAAFVNGRFMSGAQPLDAYEAMIDEERAKAQRLVDGGTPREEVYAKILASAQTQIAPLEKPDGAR
jgi:protein-disulfide isomerase